MIYGFELIISGAKVLQIFQICKFWGIFLQAKYNFAMIERLRAMRIAYIRKRVSALSLEAINTKAANHKVYRLFLSARKTKNRFKDYCSRLIQ